MSRQSEMVNMFECSQCSHQFASAFQLNHHIQRKHKNVHAPAKLFHAVVEPELLNCICCDYKSHHQIQLYEHCKQAHSPRSGHNEIELFCGELAGCLRDYCKSDSIFSLMKHHDLREKLVKLPRKLPTIRLPKSSTGQTKCTESLVGTFEFVEVMQSDTVTTSSNACKDIKLFKCDHCSYQTKRMPDFKRHFLCRHASNEEINWFQCNHCSYRAKQKFHLKTHMLQHASNDEINWFRCNHCSYRAKQKSALNTHVLQHVSSEEINWFECKQCSHRFKRKFDLKRHMLQHGVTNEKLN